MNDKTIYPIKYFIPLRCGGMHTGIFSESKWYLSSKYDPIIDNLLIPYSIQFDENQQKFYNLIGKNKGLLVICYKNYDMTYVIPIHEPKGNVVKISKRFVTSTEIVDKWINYL